MTRDEAMARVRKCFRLGRSPNPHEAAAALRQAQALMRAHGIRHLSIETVQSKGRRLHASDSHALRKGYLDGKANAVLHHGIAGGKAPRRIGHGG